MYGAGLTKIMSLWSDGAADGGRDCLKIDMVVVLGGRGAQQLSGKSRRSDGGQK